MLTITAIIITKNEAHNIKTCLESLNWVDEIIVLDSLSTDGTPEICRSFGKKVKVIETDWPGFGKQKNRALAQATGDWILSIDADEIITPELQQEILKLITTSQYVAFKIPRLTYFLGRALKHCFNPHGDAPIRLIKKRCGVFTEDPVHEKIITDGAIGICENFLIHNSFRNCEDLLEKTNRYSTLGVAKLIEKGVKPGILKTLGHSCWAFFRIYIVKRGFLDGWPGFVVAINCAEGTFYRYTKLMEYFKK